MKPSKTIGLFGLLLSSFILGCKKSAPETDQQLTSLQEVRHFFETEVVSLSDIPKSNDSAIRRNPRTDQKGIPSWEHAVRATSGVGEGFLVPLNFEDDVFIHMTGSKYAYPISRISKLFIYRDAYKKLQAVCLTYFPDDNSDVSSPIFAGHVIAENWQGKKVGAYKIQTDGILFSESLPQIPNSRMECVYFEGYNYSAQDPEGYHYSQLIGCYFTPSLPAPVVYEKELLPEIGGGGGTKPLPRQPLFSLLSGNDPIPSIQSYLNCFDNIPGTDNDYRVTVCVAQPSAGRRNPWFPTNPVNNDLNPFLVGHSFLVLSQTRGGNTTARNVGFYPVNNVGPFSPISPGHLNNDQYRDYDVRLVINVTSSQFFTLLEHISLTANAEYNLNTNNCTTFIISGLARAGINIPATHGTWLNGGGYNPGDLGQDIREMPSSPTMSPSAVTGPHPNKGICN